MGGISSTHLQTMKLIAFTSEKDRYRYLESTKWIVRRGLERVSHLGE
jgi:hypothetical protein